MNPSVREKILHVSFKGTARLDPRIKFIMLIVLGFVSFSVDALS